MDPEDPLIQAILEEPHDTNARLIYADWLEEQGDVRSEWLRLEVELAGLAPESAAAREKRRRFHQLRAQVDPAWRAIFEQPAVALANPTPYPTSWWGVGLGEHRQRFGTYGGYEYAAQPPLPSDKLRGDFAWLLEDGQECGECAPADPAAWRQMTAAALAALQTQAAAHGVRLPVSFVAFIERPGLASRVRSCTACYFDLSDRLVPDSSGEGFLLRFLNDQQGCLYWYLYLTEFDSHAVVSSWKCYDDDFFDGFDEEDAYADPGPALVFCAPSFESFLYRFWIENEIWYAVHWRPSSTWARKELTAEQRAYLAHFHE